MKVVVVGSTGFIGSNIFNSLDKAKEYDLIGISKNEIDLSRKNSHVALSNYLTADCIVIMCAGVKKQLGDNLDIFEKNLNIVNNFCRSVSRMSPKKIIYFSSASVYGEDVVYSEKISEKTPVQPITYYGIAKYTAERLLEKTCTENEAELVILRPPLIYGKNDRSRGYGPTGFTYKAINNEEIILWGDGTEYREFIYVEDVSKIINRLINSDHNGVFNLVSGRSYNFQQILDSLSGIIGSGIKVKEHQRTKAKVDHHYSNKVLNDLVGDFKFTSLKSGLADMYQSLITLRKEEQLNN